MDRRGTILAGLRLGGLGLEIGPGPHPIAAGSPGLDVRTLDVVDQAGLAAKFAGVGEDVSGVVPIDYVWSGQPYRELVGEARFDWIVASHVIEHVPDIAGFIAECASILAPGGVLSLAVPDKRGTFDFYRPPSGLGAVVDSHLQGRTAATAGAMAEFEMNFCDHAGRPDAPPLVFDAARVRMVMDAVRAGQSFDVHAWTFTPSSFRLLIEDLHALGLIPMREAAFGGGIAHEFYVQLSREGAGPGLAREALGRRALEDLGSAAGQERMDAVEAEVAALSAELSALKSTLSWKLTAPLRALRRAAR